jgi:Flp pilus assembly pilin Flp
MKGNPIGSRPAVPTTKGVAVLTSLKRESGQTMAEYGVVLAVITSAIITALLVFSGAIQAAYERVAALIV